MKSIIAFTFILFSLTSFAKEVFYSLRSPKALLMGDAYTTLAENDYTLFYNPATLGRHSGFSFYPLPIHVAASDPSEDMDRLNEEVATTTTALYNQLSGFPIHIGASIAPSIKLGRFGISVYSAAQTNITLLNNTHPMIDIYHKEDNGFIMGYAAKSGHLSFGFALKYLKRRGAEGVRSLFDPDLIEAIGSGTMDTPGDFAAILGEQEGKGWGFDLGVEYFKKTGSSEVAVGLSIMDVNGTKLYTGAVESTVPKQPMAVNFGMSIKQDYGIFDYILSADLHPLTAKIENTRRIHLGLEVGTPVIRALAGYNAGYFSYGAELDIGAIDFYLGFYDVEIGSGYKKKKANRFLLYVSLLDFAFDM
jgi:hypothetical protein